MMDSYYILYISILNIKRKGLASSSHLNILDILLGKQEQHDCFLCLVIQFLPLNQKYLHDQWTKKERVIMCDISAEKFLDGCLRQIIVWLSLWQQAQDKELWRENKLGYMIVMCSDTNPIRGMHCNTDAGPFMDTGLKLVNELWTVFVDKEYFENVPLDRLKMIK